MNLYEFEGKQLFETHGIKIPKGITVRKGDDYRAAYQKLKIKDVVVKAQVLSGKRGKHNGIFFASCGDDAVSACETLFAGQIRNQYVAAVRIEERLIISEEHYLSITYDTNEKQPILMYSTQGGVDIEDVSPEFIQIYPLDIREQELPKVVEHIPYAKELWNCFLAADLRVIEINPLVKTTSGEWIAADAKVAIDDDAFYRHEEWKNYEPRTMLGRPATDREIMVKKIDEGENYYRGTAGKYIEMDGDIATLFIGGGASIANMDAMIELGLKPANYTEYSGNPPREKVYELTKLVLSKPGLRGLWIVGVVSNFTNVKETFAGTVDALDEIKPAFPIVIRRDGPFGEEGRQLMRECAERNGLTMKIFGKETPMGDTAKVLADLVNGT